MKRWSVGGGLVVALALAAPVQAQRAGTVEAGLFGRYSMPEAGAGPRDVFDQFGIGGRLGLYFLRDLGIEGDLSLIQTRDSVSAGISQNTAHVRLIGGIPLSRKSSILLGVGYARNAFGGPIDRIDDGYGALVGFRTFVTDNAAIRIDGTADLFSAPANYLNYGLQVGLSIMFGAKEPEPAPEPAPAPVAAAAPADSDGDGVPDTADRCPNTPRGESVDANGCSASQRDADGDGVNDAADRCPNTPRGESVDANGCSASQRDADGDGVPDSRDKCPATPRGESVDANGCSASQRDTDGDGVSDALDKCPNTPAGAAVDATGCIPVFEAGRRTLTLEGVNFEYAKAVLTPESQGVLDKIVGGLIDHPEISVEVAGFTDSRGSRTGNMRLSQARAEAVRDYLLSKGVPASQLSAKGYGPDQPVASNATDEGRAQNRRVELRQTN